MREKLIELIAKAKRSMWGKSGLSCELARNSYIAEFLIANGVTIATDNNVGDKLTPTAWIPVTERLPEYGQTVVVRVHFPFDGDARMAVTTYDQHYNPHFWKRVTHWMPLPEPPKEPTL